MNSKWKKLLSLCPQVQLNFSEEELFKEWKSDNKWQCLYGKWAMTRSKGNDYTHFLCRGCYGQNHEYFEKAPVQVRHPLHPKHSLQLILMEEYSPSKICYGCDEHIQGVIYYCFTCNIAICIACVEKKPLLSIDHPKWHEHKLALFPSQASFTCNICALKYSSCPFYICPPCDFVVHRSCMSLPRLIRISRHLHRLSFTYSFKRGDFFCGVCRGKIDSDYGGYSCIKDGCSYAAHSRCVTQSSMWDGIDLEGVPEESEEEVFEPFVKIRDGIIQHFSHQHHHLRLDENTERADDENNLCRACITPIYFGNFYYCLQCHDFILHESCANLSRKVYHPLHPHLLTLVTNDTDVIFPSSCSACPRLCSGFFYACPKGECHFQVHVQCATIYEPLVHESHMHPLFLTSRPEEEQRTCGVCNGSEVTSNFLIRSYTYETFNCIEECGFALCFACATLPYKVRYKHDKHALTLSYGEETSTMEYWCEICEGELNPKERFYKCDDYCCITLHTYCLVQSDLYMKPHLTLIYDADEYIKVLPNNGMSRPLCTKCGDGKRCPHKFFYMFRSSTLCSLLEAVWLFLNKDHHVSNRARKRMLSYRRRDSEVSYME